MQGELSNLKSLVDHAGWSMVLEYAQGQIENRMPGILKKLTNLLEIVDQEYEKGEVSGIELFRRIPDIVISDLEEKIMELEEELETNASRKNIDREERDASERDRGELFEPPI